MRRRFTINDEGLLVDRDGVVLGKVTSLTIDMPSGGKGESSSMFGQLPQIKKDSPLAPGVEDVWEAFVEMREREGKPLRSTRSSPSVLRMISKGLKEVEGPGDLKRAILGLAIWQKQRGGSLDLSRVLQTRPGGNSLRDQIEFFIGLAGEGGIQGGDTTITADEMVKINRLKDIVTQGVGKPHRVEEVQNAIAKLEDLGWTVQIEPGSMPTFIAP